VVDKEEEAAEGQDEEHMAMVVHCRQIVGLDEQIGQVDSQEQAAMNSLSVVEEEGTGQNSGAPKEAWRQMRSILLLPLRNLRAKGVGMIEV
jgi:uncharacterized protein YjeT (DUF2065 family)